MAVSYLPIGTVVSLEEATKKLMIIGQSVQLEGNEQVFDYIGVPYPEGYIDSETMFLFMHKDIKEAHYIGYVNAEAQIFRTAYNEALKTQGTGEA